VYALCKNVLAALTSSGGDAFTSESGCCSHALSSSRLTSGVAPATAYFMTSP
jgi:hypothetical protein